MGNMDGRLGNATPTTSWHELHWWKSPRWIVIRIEALAVVAIIISFFLAAFGSGRRWSNSWIVQKGFFAAQVLSLSLGTYSIGLMQSSSVKSEMYPIWTVCLFTLFGCIDPVTTYNGLDYKGPLSKVVFRICLNCGYVLLMSISTISNVVGNTAIITLSAITFIKGFHRSFALVHQTKMRDMVYTCRDLLGFSYGETCIIKKDEPQTERDEPLTESDDSQTESDLFQTELDSRRSKMIVDHDTKVHQAHIEASIRNSKDKRLRSCYDVCVALCLSHKLNGHFLGLDYRVPRPETLNGIDYEWALKVIEIELAFVYDAFFTGNPFFHYYQAKTASFWALASFTGICFVLVATAIPGGTTRRSGASGYTKVVGTTTADLAITFGILVSLALLQLLQLVRSWTSNWARAAVACAYARKEKGLGLSKRGQLKLSGWMRLKVFVATSINLFDRYLWQDKISQYSILPKPRLSTSQERKGEPKWARRLLTGWKGKDEQGWCYLNTKHQGERIRRTCVHLVQTLGLHYIWKVIWELLSSDTNKRGGLKLDEDVKGSVIDFLGQIQSDKLDGNWLSSLPEGKGIRHFLPHFDDPRLLTKPGVHCYRYTSCVMTWHIATWYCELAEQYRQEISRRAEVETSATAGYYLRKAAAAAGNYFQRRRARGVKTRDHRRVANALSQYCVYLVKSAPELLPGPVAWTKHVYNRFRQEVKESERIQRCDKDTVRGLTNTGRKERICRTNWYVEDTVPDYRTRNGLALGKLLMGRPNKAWKTLALVWVQLLVYAAPYGNVEEHMRHLSHGGEFITHLWALLYHLDIREWKLDWNLHEISTMEDAERVLTEDGPAVVAFLYRQDESYDDEVAAASLLEDRVRYYYTENSCIASLFGIQGDELPDLVFLEKGTSNHTFTLYDGEFRAYDIARFVTENIGLARDQARAQSWEDDGLQSEDGIEEDYSAYQSWEDDEGQSEAEIEEADGDSEDSP